MLEQLGQDLLGNLHVANNLKGGTVVSPLHEVVILRRVHQEECLAQELGDTL